MGARQWPANEAMSGENASRNRRRRETYQAGASRMDIWRNIEGTSKPRATAAAGQLKSEARPPAPCESSSGS